jgi:predicted RNase H-like nuclease (RuvC/YqgF family)
MKSLVSVARELGWSQSRFMRRLRSGVLDKLKNEINDEDFFYAIDDTSNIKSRKNVFGIGN